MGKAPKDIWRAGDQARGLRPTWEHEAKRRKGRNKRSRDWTRETASKEEKRGKILLSCRERLYHVSFFPVTVPQIKHSYYSMLVCDPVVSKYSHDVTCDGPGFPSGSGTSMSSGEWTGHVCPSQCMGTPQLSGSRDRRPLVGRPQGEGWRCVVAAPGNAQSRRKRSTASSHIMLTDVPEHLSARSSRLIHWPVLC